MLTRLEIAAIGFRLETSPGLALRIAHHYAEFCRGTSTDPTIGFRLHARGLPQRATPGPEEFWSARLDAGDGRRLRLEGDVRGRLDLDTRTGAIAGRDGLAAADTLVRLALSSAAAECGWLLLHGAAIAADGGGWVLVLGQSGAGKSTAAAAFESFCDEWVFLRPAPAGAECASTPYWRGRPGRAECRAVVCLERGEPAVFARVAGAAALAALSHHVVRFAPLRGQDERMLELLAAIAAAVPVHRAACPSGGRYLPFLRNRLEGAGVAPSMKPVAA